jgi:hypothetical protein
MTQESDARLAWAVECFTNAREELLYRAGRRDGLLTKCLLAQSALWALSSGLEFGGVTATKPQSTLLYLTAPAGLLFALLYFVEDAIIHHLSSYVATIDPGTTGLRQWDASDFVRRYSTGHGLQMRVATQCTGFAVLPLLAVFFGAENLDRISYGAGAYFAAFLAVTLFLIGHGYRLRLSTGQESSAQR